MVKSWHENYIAIIILAFMDSHSVLGNPTIYIDPNKVQKSDRTKFFYTKIVIVKKKDEIRQNRRSLVFLQINRKRKRRSLRFLFLFFFFLVCGLYGI